MKSIKKNNNSFWMIGSFLIILVLFLLLLSKTPIVITNDSIDFNEVVALIQALEADAQNENKYETLRMEYINEYPMAVKAYMEPKEIPLTRICRNLAI